MYVVLMWLCFTFATLRRAMQKWVNQCPYRIIDTITWLMIYSKWQQYGTWNLETLMMLMKHGWLGNLNLSMEKRRNIIHKIISRCLTENSFFTGKFPRNPLVFSCSPLRIAICGVCLIFREYWCGSYIGGCSNADDLKRHSDDFRYSYPVSYPVSLKNGVLYLYISKNWGYPTRHPAFLGFSIKNHPAIGDSPPNLEGILLEELQGLNTPGGEMLGGCDHFMAIKLGTLIDKYW